jgi:hypothetical protein
LSEVVVEPSCAFISSQQYLLLVLACRLSLDIACLVVMQALRLLQAPVLVLLLCSIISSLVLPAAADCVEGDPVVTPCPSALAAAQALTGNNAQLPVSNAAFDGACTAGGVEGMLLITTFGCHHLATTMPLGKHIALA